MRDINWPKRDIKIQFIHHILHQRLFKLWTGSNRAEKLPLAQTSCAAGVEAEKGFRDKSFEWVFPKERNTPLSEVEFFFFFGLFLGKNIAAREITLPLKHWGRGGGGGGEDFRG